MPISIISYHGCTALLVALVVVSGAILNTHLYLLPFLAYPGYAPGTIAVNVTWMERGFSAGQSQTHRSIYPSIFNRLRTIARYWSEIATFFLPLAFNAPVGGVPIGIPGKSLHDLQKTRIMGLPLPGSELRQFDDRLRLSRFNTIPAFDGQRDRRKDRRPAYINNVCAVWLTLDWRRRTLKCWSSSGFHQNIYSLFRAFF